LNYFNFIILGLVSSIIFCSCEDSGEASIDGAYNQIVDTHEALMKKKYNLSLGGAGAAWPEKIESISLSYHGQKKTEIEEARRMLVEAIESLLELVNANREIRPALICHPFVLLNSRVNVSFGDRRSDDLFNTEGVAYASTVKGILYYSSYNPEEGLLEDLYEEPYEEALKVVRSQKSTEFPLIRKIDGLVDHCSPHSRAYPRESRKLGADFIKLYGRVK
jgi:hypothetical protein